MLTAFTKEEYAMAYSVTYWVDKLGLVVSAKDKDSVRVADGICLRDSVRVVADGICIGPPKYCVLVTHDTSFQDLVYLLLRIPCRRIQLVEDIPPEMILNLREVFPELRIIKSISIVDSGSIDNARRYIGYVDALELDTGSGGTGKTHSRDLDKMIIDELGDKIPIIGAGGLNPNILEQYTQEVLPSGVDISSAIRDKEGRIDFKKVILLSKICRGIEVPPIRKSLSSAGF